MPRPLRTSHNDVLLALLRGARASRGITQEALAAAIGFRQADVSKVERGIRRLDVLELRVWVTALGIPFGRFASELDERLAGIEALHRQTATAVLRPKS